MFLVQCIDCFAALSTYPSHTQVLHLTFIPLKFLGAGFLRGVFLLQFFVRAPAFEEPVGLCHERLGCGGPCDHRAGLRGPINGTSREVPHRLCALVSRAHAGKGEKLR